MPIYLTPPPVNPGGPDGKGWNRLSLNAHIGDQQPQCALRPRSYATLVESFDTRRARYGGFGRCLNGGACSDCPILTAPPKRLRAFGSVVLVRLRHVHTGAFPGSTLIPAALDEPHLMDRPEEGWASWSVRWSWEDLARLEGWQPGRPYHDEHSEGFWLRKAHPQSLDGMDPCPHGYTNERFCHPCMQRLRYGSKSRPVAGQVEGTHTR